MNTRTRTDERPATSLLAPIVLLLIVSLALRPGIVSIGPILLSIRQHFRLTYSEAALLTSIPDVCMGLFVLCVPALSRRLGIERTIALSLLLLGLAIFFRALATSAPVLLFWTALVGIGIAVAGALIGGWIKEHFADQASLFMGIYAGGLSIGATIAAVGTGYIAALFKNWRYGAGMWCVIAVTALASWSYLARHMRRQTAHPADQKARAEIALPWHEGRAWLLAVFFGLSQFVAYACLAWLAPWNNEEHMSDIPGGLMLSVFTLFLAAGSFAAGGFAGKSGDRRLWLLLGTIISAVGFLGLAFLPSTWPTLFVVAIAFGQGVCFAMGMMLPLDNAAKASDGHAWTMFVLCIGYMIAALGPLSFGFLRDWRGEFSDSWLLLLAISLAMLAMIPSLKRKTIK
ncbi:CynX/NimT family MFS transporter [Paraburkholderia sp. B3]|uniref:MFS transporter n=1 Tax=Paraburkholderia sp. B3 TaxID=3134791 RepID=UPI003982320B